jgi:hypothetical protein
MKRRIVLGLVLVAVMVLSWAAVMGTGTVPPVDSKAGAGNPCVTDADCTGNRICCPISGTCTTPKGCKKDPLY